MNYKFYTNSMKSWKAMYEAASLAERSIYLEMYIMNDDMKEFNFLELLKQKAKTGVKISVILDSFGSNDLNKNTILELKKVGIELFFISSLLHRTHRKILIIDENIAFVGGVNFHQSASAWNDLVIKVKGKIVSLIIRSFAKTYAKCGGKDVFILKNRNNNPILKRMHFWLIDHFPALGKNKLKKIYETNINKAEKSIILVTPYFMPKRWMIALLHQAVLRGVRVEILVPRFTDYEMIDRINYFFMHRASKLGINFYLEKEMNHAKVMIVDSKEGMVGSHNLDFLSFDYNSEVGIFFNDLKAVQKLSVIYEEWKKESALFDHITYKPKYIDYALSPFFSLFSKIL